MSSNLNAADAEVSSSSSSSSSRVQENSNSPENINGDAGNSRQARQKSRVRLAVEDEDKITDLGFRDPTQMHLGDDGDSLIPGHGSILTGDDDRLLQELARLPPPVPIHLSFWKKLVIASGHVFNDLCASLWFTYALLYFDKVVQFSDPTDGTKKTNYAALVILIGQLVDGIATPLVGYEADQPVNFWLCNQNYGRCKSWHVMGSFLSVISFPFIFSACIGCSPGTSNWVKLIYYIPFVVIFQIGWASVQISHLALIPKMHPDDLVRTDILAKRYGFTVCSNILVFLMTWFTLGNGTSCRITPADSTQFMQIGLVAVGIGIIFTVLFHFGVKEDPDNKIKKNVSVITSRTKIIRRLSHSVDLGSGALRSRHDSVRSRKSVVLDVTTLSSSQDEEGGRGDSDAESGRILLESGSLEGRVIGFDDVRSIEEEEYVSLVAKPSYYSTKGLSLGREKMTLKDWFTLPQFYIVALIYMATRMSVNLGQVFVSYFVQYSLWLPCNTVATVPLTMFISGLLCSFGIRFLNKHLGRQVSYALSALLTIAGALMVLFLQWDGPNSEFYKTYIIYVIAALLGGGSSGILVTSLSITADMIGNNVENGAFVYGSMSFCDKLSCGLGILLVDSLKPCEYNDDDPSIPEQILRDCKDQVTPYYQNVLAYSTGGCALIGILGCILLTYRIHYQNSRMKKDDAVPS